MTREEERNKSSEDYRNFRESCGIKDPVMLDEIENAHYEGAKWADKTMIDKACEWWTHRLMSKATSSEVLKLLDDDRAAYIIQDFRKDMEG